MKNTSKNEFVIHEYLRDIDLIDDLFVVSKESRLSYNYLISVRTFFNTHLHTYEKNEDIIKDFHNRINTIEESYSTIEELALTSEPDIVGDSIVPLKSKTEIDPITLYRIVRGHIELKSKIDKLQVDILRYLTDEMLKIITKFTERKPYFKDIESDIHIGMLLRSTFMHSADEDKVTTYKVTCKQKELINELKDDKIFLPEFLKISDYSFQLEKSRELYKFMYESFNKTIMSIPKIEEEQYLKELNKKQYNLNKKMTLLTYIACLLTIISVFMAGVTTYLSYKDYSSPKVQYDERIYKELMEIHKLVDGNIQL